VYEEEGFSEGIFQKKEGNLRKRRKEGKEGFFQTTVVRG